MKPFALVTAFALASAIVTPANAQDAQEVAGEAAEVPAAKERAEDVVGLINGTIEPEDALAANFLAAVPAAQFKAIGEQLTGQFGPALGLEKFETTGATTGNFAVRMERGIASGVISVEADAPHRINGLQITQVAPVDDGAEKIAADLTALSGRTAAWFGPLEGDAVFSHGDPAGQFAVGSTFKLYVLAAVARAIENGTMAWDDVLRIDAKSFPSGMTQDWPDGAPVTVQTLATLMIAISDNTATDLLIEAVGRDAVEAELVASGHGAPERTLPFLKTLEAFVLKIENEGREYETAGTERRRAILAGLDTSDLELGRFMKAFTGTAPKSIDSIEWFMSMQDTKNLMRTLAGFGDGTPRAIMAVNAGISDAQAKEWAYVGFKGGSEPGVLNLSWLLQDEAGTYHVLTLSWNDPEAPVDTTTLTLLAQRILALAR